MKSKEEIREKLEREYIEHAKTGREVTWWRRQAGYIDALEWVLELRDEEREKEQKGNK